MYEEIDIPVDKISEPKMVPPEYDREPAKPVKSIVLELPVKFKLYVPLLI